MAVAVVVKASFGIVVFGAEAEGVYFGVNSCLAEGVAEGVILVSGTDASVSVRELSDVTVGIVEIVEHLGQRCRMWGLIRVTGGAGSCKVELSKPPTPPAPCSDCDKSKPQVYERSN